MPFDVNLQADEQLIVHLAFSPSKKSEVFHLAVTTRAIFLPRKKFFAIKDPTYFERVPLNRVAEARVKRLSPYGLWALALLMVLAGALTTGLMIRPLLQGKVGKISGIPPAIAIVGMVIPFITRRRYGLSISMVDKVFQWKPPLLVDKASRDEVENFLSQVATAFRRAGVNLSDEREVTPDLPPGAARKCKYPLAQAGNSAAPGPGILRPCYQCGNPLRIGRWADWNGFLFQCPFCGGTHGKPWSARGHILGSLFFNAFSFFFTMRWRQALPFFLGFVLLIAGISAALNQGRLSQTVELVLAGTGFLGPVAINSVLLLRHEMALKTATTGRAAPTN